MWSMQKANETKRKDVNQKTKMHVTYTRRHAEKIIKVVCTSDALLTISVSHAKVQAVT